MCVTAVVCMEAKWMHLMLFPVSFPVVGELVSKLQWGDSILTIFTIAHFAPSISAKVVIMSRNITGGGFILALHQIFVVRLLSLFRF